MLFPTSFWEASSSFPRAGLLHHLAVGKETKDNLFFFFCMCNNHRIICAQVPQAQPHYWADLSRGANKGVGMWGTRDRWHFFRARAKSSLFIFSWPCHSPESDFTKSSICKVSSVYCFSWPLFTEYAKECILKRRHRKSGCLVLLELVSEQPLGGYRRQKTETKTSFGARTEKSTSKKSWLPFTRHLHVPGTGLRIPFQGSSQFPEGDFTFSIWPSF